jgi:hypothetical protein
MKRLAGRLTGCSPASRRRAAMAHSHFREGRIGLQIILSRPSPARPPGAGSRRRRQARSEAGWRSPHSFHRNQPDEPASPPPPGQPQQGGRTRGRRSAQPPAGPPGPPPAGFGATSPPPAGGRGDPPPQPPDRRAEPQSPTRGREGRKPDLGGSRRGRPERLPPPPRRPPAGSATPSSAPSWTISRRAVRGCTSNPMRSRPPQARVGGSAEGLHIGLLPHGGPPRPWASPRIFPGGAAGSVLL